jgi:DNA-binding LacI/PurR family transcriptional regulator
MAGRLARPAICELERLTSNCMPSQGLRSPKGWETGCNVVVAPDDSPIVGPKVCYFCHESRTKDDLRVMATIGDVAKYAGVARSTVSHVLSGKRPISPATRQRVHDAIDALNFTPNAGAKALATSKSSIIGLVVNVSAGEYAPAIMQYIMIVSETARSLGYDVLLITEADGSAGITRVTRSNLVDGLIVMEVRRNDARVGTLLAARQPGVLIGAADGNSRIDSVDLDFAEAGRVLTRHLVDKGHREALFITVADELLESDLGFAWRFRNAVVAEAESLGMKLTVINGAVNPVERAGQIGTALDGSPQATALIVHNDGALVELPHLLAGRGLSVPQDISVVSVHADQFGAMFSLPYTAVEASPKVVAERAVQLLASKIKSGVGSNAIEDLVPPTLIDRGSTRHL